MTIFRNGRGWASPPLVVQILALLIGALVVAQLVTLLLTLVLPPEPPRRYEMGDIVAALRGEQPARPLERHLQAGPPDLAARGWLVSPTTTARLAKALGVNDDRVAFGFYTELPVGGLVGAPPSPQRLPADARPTRPLPPLAALLPRHARRPAPLAMPSLPILAIAAAVAVDDGQDASSPMPHQPGAPPTLPPGAVPGGWMGGGFPPAMPGGRRPPRGGPSSRSDRATRDGIPDVTVARDPRTQQPVAVQLGHPATAQTGHDGTGATDQGRAVNDGQGLSQQATVIPGQTPPDTGFGRRADAGLPRGDRLFGTPALRPTAAPALPASTATRPAVTTSAPTPAPTSRPVDAVRLATPRPTANAPASSAITAPAPHGSPVATPTPRGEAPRATIGPLQQPLPILRPSTGLFGLAAAPFVEGDFVAAVRQPDGRWAVVSPAEEGFPNAWQRRVLLWFGLSLLAVAPIAWAFARRIVGPLQGFAQAAELLGRDPSAAILPLEGPAEVGRAAHAFNQMQSRLRSFVDDRTAMIGAISHDLRTPLTRLRFRIEDVPEDQHAGLLGEIEAMEAMISSVIAYMRDAATPGVRERRDMAELVGDVVEDAALIGGDVRTVQAEPAPVDIDALGIRRVLDNLLTNAIKYGGGTARVALHVEDACAVADIVDDGPGIPEAEIERVFEPFYRSESARASSREGSGLGLAVCRSIARAHGGDVRLFRSPAGFTARVTLPLAYDGERQLAA